MTSIIIIIIIITIIYHLSATYHAKHHAEQFDIATLNHILNYITIMSSWKQNTIIISEYPVLTRTDCTINIVVIDTQAPRANFQDAISFKICSRKNIIKMFWYLDNLSTDKLVIISVCGRPFNSLINLGIPLEILQSKLKRLGATRTDFKHKSNYIFISLEKQAIFEEISDEPLFYPKIEITYKDCKINPANTFPPQKYLFFNDKVFNDETVLRCATEASARSAQQFGVIDHDCIDLGTKKAIDSVAIMDSSDQCVDGVGNSYYLSVYGFKKLFSTNNTLNTNQGGLYTFYLPNLKIPAQFMIPGEYKVEKHSVKSFILAEDHYAYLIDSNKQKIIKYSKGPLIENNITDIFDTIYVSKYTQYDSIFCDNNSICFTYARGSYMLPPYFYLKITTVTQADTTESITLFETPNFTDPITSLRKELLTNIYTVEFPKIIRAIKIL